MWKMWKRITCSILIAAMIFAEVPMSALAASNTADTQEGTRVFGDADGDGELNAKDIAITLQYIVEDDPSGFHFSNADVTEDGIVDLKDLLAMRRRMAEPEYADSSTIREVPASGRASGKNTAEENDADQGRRPSQSTGSESTGSGNSGSTTTTTTYYQVTFALGSGQDSIDLPAAKTYAAGTRIDTLPTPVRQDVMFLGWYYDAALTQQVGASDTVDRNMTLYAKTGSLDGLNIQETLNYITAADVETTFQLELSGTNINAGDLTIIQVSANNAVVPFTVDSNGNVTITNGWEPGHTYKAVLKDDSSTVFVHEGQPQQTSIRVFNIIVKKAPVQNLSLNDAEGGLKYIPRTDVSGMSDSMQGLFTASLKAGNVGETTIDKVDQTGTFTYSGSETLSVGDIIAVYEGRHPKQRETGAEREAAIAYVEITGVSGTTYSYRTANVEDVLFTPDVLPVSSNKKTDGGDTLTILKSELDFSDPVFADMGLNYDTTIDKGDFLAFYEGSLESAGNLTYGRIISVQENAENDTYTITYADVSEREVLASMDLYTEENREIRLTDEQISEIEQDILLQAEESGFVDEAAQYLTTLALETDGFRELAGDFDIQSCTITFADGRAVGDNNLSLLAADSGRAKITKKEIKPTVHVGKLDHFENNMGIRIELNMELEITVDLGKDRSIVITLSAVFEQEVMLSVNASGGAIWKKKWIFPYIADYRLNANLDMGTYTGIGITATARTKGKDDEKFDWGMSTGNSAGDKIVNIGKQIKDLMDKKDKFLNHDLVGGKDDDDDDDDGGIPISGGLEEKYAAMIKEADDSWIDIFRTEIFSNEGYVDPFYILCYGIKADFVVGANLYVTMGMTFTYEVAKRYNFSILLFERECTNDTIDLKAPEYEFTFYVMGTMGIRAGVEFEIGVGLFSLKVDSIGITAGTGVYAQLWGYFFYDLKGVKNSDTGKYDRTSRYSGAMLVEIGVYLKITFKAQLFSSKKLTYQPTLYENYWPFFTIGERENVLGFAEKDDDGDEIPTEYDIACVRTMTLPSSLFSMRYLDLITGEIGGDEKENETTKVTEMKAGRNCDDDTESHFTIEMSDSRYTYNPADNTVTVNPGGLSVLPDCEMTIRWKSGTLAFSSEPIERKVTIRWSDPQNARYISFDSRGGSPVRQILGDPGMAVTLPKNPGKKGYDFGGWYTDSACSTPFALTTMPEDFSGEKGITVYARWIPRNDTPYTVEHYRQELDGTYTLTDTDRLTGTTDSAAAVTCKTSGEWKHFEVKDMPTARIAGNGTTVVRVYYDRKTYTVEFTYGTPSGVDVIPAAKTYTAKYGATIYAPLLALRGYEMAGFGGVPESGEVVVNGNASYDARWTAGQADYKVEHYSPRVSGDGYILSGENAVQKDTALSGSTVQVADLIRTIEGLTFQQAMVNGEEADQAVIYGDGSTVIRLYYSRNVHTLTLDPNGGSLEGGTEASVLQVAYGLRPGVTAPERTGYEFAGWYTDRACAEEDLFSTETAPAMPDRDLTLYAKWTPKSGIAYKVEHYRQDVSGDGYTLFETEDKTGTAGAQATAAARSYEHFSLNSSAEDAVPTGVIAADGSLVLKLYYDRETFTVTYDPDGGTLEGNETSRTFRYGAAFSAPDVTRAGYGLEGWFDGTVRYDSIKTITANVTVTARWIAGATNYKVEHYLQDTAGVYPAAPGYTDTRSGTAGAAINPGALKRSDTGFAFDKSGEASYTIDGDGSTVVKLYYTRNKHTLTWDLGGGTAPEGYTRGEVYFGATVMAPAATKTGYICAWDSTPPATMPDKDLTFTAGWTPITYTVKFSLNGGSMAGGKEPLKDVTIKYDETFTLPADGDITRKHYNANGWSTDKNRTEADLQSGATLKNLAAADGAIVTLYALWTPVKYHFDFYHNGGTIEGGNVSGQYYRYDYTIEDIQAGPIQMPTPAMENYDFLGWYKNADFSGDPVTAIPVTATSGASYYAKWERSKVPVVYTVLPALDSGTNTPVSTLLAEGAAPLEGVIPGGALPTPELANGEFLYWCTNREDHANSKVTTVPEDQTDSYQVYLVYIPENIASEADLKLLSACSELLGEDLSEKKFTLTDDFALSTDWKPIKNFIGTLDGAGHAITISGMPIVEKLGKHTYANNHHHYTPGTIKNLKIELENIELTSENLNIDDSWGSIVIHAIEGYIENCSVSGGIIRVSDDVSDRFGSIGGIVGIIDIGEIRNCSVGEANKPLQFSETEGRNKQSSYRCGGIAGGNAANIIFDKPTEVYLARDHYKATCVGGIVGENFGGSIAFGANCEIHFICSPKGRGLDCGMIVGYLWKNNKITIGKNAIVTVHSNIDISNDYNKPVETCYVNGAVTGKYEKTDVFWGSPDNYKVGELTTLKFISDGSASEASLSDWPEDETSFAPAEPAEPEPEPAPELKPEPGPEQETESEPEPIPDSESAAPEPEPTPMPDPEPAAPEPDPEQETELEPEPIPDSEPAAPAAELEPAPEPEQETESEPGPSRSLSLRQTRPRITARITHTKQ